jgi:hypothetical protein
LAAFDIEVVATATGSVSITWNPPTERTDGTPLGDLAGYRIYFGTDPEDFHNSIAIHNPGITTYLIEELTPATYFVVATSFDSTGAESWFSNVASKIIH